MTLTGWNVFTQKDGNAPLLTGLSGTAKPTGMPDEWLLFETDTGKGYYSSGGAWILATSGGGGTVTAVTASAPLASSGGTTPDISLTLPSDATKFLNGVGGFTVPPGTGGSGIDQLTGDVTAGPGSGSQAATLANSGVSAGTYTKLTVDAKGRSTVGATATLASADFANQGATTTVLHGNAAGNPAFGAVVEADITLANNTTNNVSTTKHGFTPILPNDATKYLDGTGAYTTPSGGSGTVTTTGSPASGNLSKFSGATSITNADLTGDVTTSGTVAATIANDAVTYAKMQNAAANTIIARAASSSGDLSEVALAASQLAGRGSTGDIAAIALGAGLSMTGASLSSAEGAWIQIGEVIMPGGTTTATFSSIPNSYKHLVIIGRGRDSNTGAAVDNYIRFNGDTGANYQRQYLFATGATVVGGIANSQTKANAGIFTGSSATAAYVGQFEMLIPWYSSNAFKKTGVTTLGCIANNTGTGTFVGLQLAAWNDASVITQIDIIATANFDAGTSFELYGILNV